MSEFVYWILETSIKEGEFDNLKTLMTEMVEATEQNEPGALNYEWSVNGENTKCTLFERYADSEAALKHLGTFQKEYAARFMSMLEIKRFTVYGNPNETLQGVLKSIGAVIMEPLGGFSR